MSHKNRIPKLVKDGSLLLSKLNTQVFSLMLKDTYPFKAVLSTFNPFIEHLSHQEEEILPTSGLF